MDVKGLHQAIQELRAELERVKLAIGRIEAIAAAVAREQQSGDNSSDLRRPPARPARGQG